MLPAGSTINMTAQSRNYLSGYTSSMNFCDYGICCEGDLTINAAGPRLSRRPITRCSMRTTPKSGKPL